MKRDYKTILLTAVAALAPLFSTGIARAQSSPNFYKVFISLDGVTTNDFGALSRVFAEKSDIIRRCAIENGASNLNGLTLVYDRVADALEVINRTNGAVVCSPIAFSGGFSLSNRTGTVRERLAFVYVEGSAEASGTFKATEKTVSDRNGNVIGFTLTGKLQFALVPSDRSSKIFSGFLTIGPRFFPLVR